MMIVMLGNRMHDVYQAWTQAGSDASHRSMCMRYPAAETAERHERILKAAGRLFRQRGLTGVSVSEVMKATGLTHGPFYNHFASKEDLISESIGVITSEAVRDLRNCPANEAGRRSYLAGYLSEAHCADPGGGCPLAALGPEGAREPGVRSALARHLAASLDALASHFPWSSKARARRDAIHAMAAMVGAIVLARSTDDEDLRREILDGVLSRVS
jgi:TetR/AcrR family transcriptional regulator, transcriptional repressor for nem operon